MAIQRLIFNNSQRQFTDALYVPICAASIARTLRAVIRYPRLLLTHGFLAALAGGFELTTIVDLSAGVPLAITQATTNGLGALPTSISACIATFRSGNGPLQFRAQAFNVAFPTSDVASASFGQITSSYDPRVIHLSLHLLF